MDNGAVIPVTDTSTISDAASRDANGGVSAMIPVESQRLLRLATYASVSVAAVLIDDAACLIAFNLLSLATTADDNCTRRVIDRDHQCLEV